MRIIESSSPHVHLIPGSLGTVFQGATGTGLGPVHLGGEKKGKSLPSSICPSVVKSLAEGVLSRPPMSRLYVLGHLERSYGMPCLSHNRDERR